MSKMTPLLLTLALVACQSTLPNVSGPAPSGQPTALTVKHSQPKPLPVLSIPTREALESASGRVVAAGAQEALVMNVRIHRPSFRTQAFDLNRIQFLKGLVRAIDVDPRENKEGFVPVDVSEKSLRIEGIPKGKNRIVTVQAYEGSVGNEVLIPDIVLKAIYSSLPDSDEVSVNFSLQSTLAANVLEALIDKPLGPNETPADREALINGLPIADPNTPNAPGTLEELINSITQGTQTPPTGDNPFGGTPVSPSAIDPDKIADAIITTANTTPEHPIPPVPSDNGELAPWLKPTGTVELVAQNPAQTNYTNHQIIVQITDPGSPPIIIRPQSSPADPGAPGNPNGPVSQNDIDLSFSQIPEGTWDVIATVVDENGQVRSEERLQVTVDENGNVTVRDPNAADPTAPIVTPTFTFPPFLDEVTDEGGTSQPTYPGGSTIILTGDGFDPNNPTQNVVTVGGVQVPVADVEVIDATTIKIVLPPSVGGDNIPITVTTNGEISNEQQVNITPVIVALDRPFVEATGTDAERTVVISLAGFNPTEYPNLTLNFKDADGNTIVVTPQPQDKGASSITVIVPPNAVTGPIEVVRNETTAPLPSPVLTIGPLYSGLVNFIGPATSHFYSSDILTGDPAALRFSYSNSLPTNPTNVLESLGSYVAYLGSYYVATNVDGDPHGITVDGCNAIYVVGKTLVKFDLQGVKLWSVALQTVSEDATVLGSTIYVAATNGNRIDRYSTIDGNYLGSLFTSQVIVGPEGIELSKNGEYLYVSSNTTPNSPTYSPTNQVRIFKIRISDGVTEVLAGGQQRATPATGTESISSATFHHLEGLGVDDNDNVYVAEADSNFRQIRKITPTKGAVPGFVTIHATFDPGFAIHEIRVEPDGSVVVPGEQSKKIYLIKPNGEKSVIAGKVSTYASNPNQLGVQGLAQGNLGESTFIAPVGVDFDPDGNLYITDRYWGIRKINRLSPRSGAQICGAP